MISAISSKNSHDATIEAYSSSRKRRKRKGLKDPSVVRIRKVIQR
jgi:hypothetical protein